MDLRTVRAAAASRRTRAESGSARREEDACGRGWGARGARAGSMRAAGGGGVQQPGRRLRRAPQPPRPRRAHARRARDNPPTRHPAAPPPNTDNSIRTPDPTSPSQFYPLKNEHEISSACKKDTILSQKADFTE